EPAPIAPIVWSNVSLVTSSGSFISSVAYVQFMVHSNGSQPPVELQKAAMLPAGSTTGVSEKANRVPDVPRLIVSLPRDTLPVPTAAIMLSPPPGATRMPAGRPKRLEKESLVV